MTDHIHLNGVLSCIMLSTMYGADMPVTSDLIIAMMYVMVCMPPCRGVINISNALHIEQGKYSDT